MSARYGSDVFGGGLYGGPYEEVVVLSAPVVTRKELVAELILALEHDAMVLRNTGRSQTTRYEAPIIRRLDFGAKVLRRFVAEVQVRRRVEFVAER